MNTQLWKRNLIIDLKEISILSDVYFGYSDVGGGCWERKSSVMLDVVDGFAILITNIHFIKKIWLNQCQAVTSENSHQLRVNNAIVTLFRAVN